MTVGDKVMVSILQRPTLVQVEKRVSLPNLTWAKYQQILAALPQSRAAHLTYDRGTLEISVPSEEHEHASELIGLLIRILAVEMGLKLKSIRSTTLDREDLDRAAEPDNAYYIQNQPQVAGRTVDLTIDPLPDLVVEVDLAHTDIDKNRLYASLGIPEFWRFDGPVWRIYQRQGETYQECDRSPTFPVVDKADFYQFLAQAQQDEVEAEIQFRTWVKAQIATET